MVRSHTVMVWSDYLPKKSLVGGEWWWQTKFNVSPGPGLWSLVPGPDLGPGPGPELDNYLEFDEHIKSECSVSFPHTFTFTPAMMLV